MAFHGVGGAISYFHTPRKQLNWMSILVPTCSCALHVPVPYVPSCALHVLVPYVSSCPWCPQLCINFCLFFLACSHNLYIFVGAACALTFCVLAHSLGLWLLVLYVPLQKDLMYPCPSCSCANVFTTYIYPVFSIEINSQPLKPISQRSFFIVIVVICISQTK